MHPFEYVSEKLCSVEGWFDYQSKRVNHNYIKKYFGLMLTGKLIFTIYFFDFDP